jgi:hypothetical protein
VTSFNEGPEVKQLSCVSEIAINGCVAVILGVNRKVVGDLTVSLFLVEEGFDRKITFFLDYFVFCLTCFVAVA